MRIKEHEIVVKQVIEYYEKNKEECKKAIGRYEGWCCIFDNNSIIINEDYDFYLKEFNKQGYQFKRWSGLSGNSDDKDEFAIKK